MGEAGALLTEPALRDPKMRVGYLVGDSPMKGEASSVRGSYLTQYLQTASAALMRGMVREDSEDSGLVGVVPAQGVDSQQTLRPR